MLVGIPKEIKDHEYRIAATPAMVKALVSQGNEVIVQSGSLLFADADFQNAGAKVVARAEEVYEASLILKVKEPQESEYPLLKKGQILFCYLHLAANPVLTRVLLEKDIIAIAYETVVDHSGGLPLLIPMSEIAGRMAVQVGANLLQISAGGKGVLLGGIPGVSPAKVVILGGGIVGREAARMATGLGADVTLLDIEQERLRHLDELFGPRVKTLFSTPWTIEEAVLHADLLIGAVLIPGKMAPKLVTKAMVQKMQKGSVIVDVAIDQGGCIETSRPTTHSDPTYKVDGVIHYSVTNMPGTYAKTATEALVNATGNYVLQLAKLGLKALSEDPGFAMGLNIASGKITHPNIK